MYKIGLCFWEHSRVAQCVNWKRNYKWSRLGHHFSSFCVNLTWLVSMEANLNVSVLRLTGANSIISERILFQNLGRWSDICIHNFKYKPKACSHKNMCSHKIQKFIILITCGKKEHSSCYFNVREETLIFFFTSEVVFLWKLIT